MRIQKLDPKNYQGREFVLKYSTTGYYDIEKLEEGFQITYKKFDTVTDMSFKDKFFNDWLEEPVAYGAFEGEKLLGYVEGTLEKWNNRYRISNICIFEEVFRKVGIGTQLMDTILQEAILSGARMVVLETQTCNENAISFYKKHGFEIIGFDLYAYSNTDSKRHEVRIEMGKFL